MFQLKIILFRRRIWMVIYFVSFVIFSINGESDLSKKRACIIGAGPYGTFSAKQLAENLDVLELIVFEKNSDVGGTWIYSENGEVDEHGLPVHSGIYKSLRTSGPKELMACPDFDFKGETRSSVSHETVLEFLRNYTDHFNLRQFIRFNTLVEKVAPISRSSNWRKSKWLVTTRNLNTNVSDEVICNFILVCTGHTHKPLVPDIPGIKNFPGRVLHSHSYRRPEEFSDKTVVLLGSGNSGQELAYELSNYVRTVYLSHRHEKIPDMPKNVIQVPRVISANGRVLHLQDGSIIEADSFIFCTGYKNNFPFLEASSGIEVHEKYLYPLYKQVVNVKHPSMSFIGFPNKLSPFCLKPYVQAKYYAALIRGEYELPSMPKMIKDAKALLPASPETQKNNWQWDYFKKLAQFIGFKYVDDFYERKMNIWECNKANNVRHYKEFDLRTLKDGSIVLVKSDNNQK